MDEFDFESGMGSAAPALPPKTFVMTAGMHTGVRPFHPPKVWDSEEKFHPAAKELAAICEANMARRPIGNSTPTRVKVKHQGVDAKEVAFGKKLLSSAAFQKFEEARATVKSAAIGRSSAHWRQSNGHNVKVIPLGTSSASPSKYRNGGSLPFSPLRNKSDGYKLLRF